ncbi:hypothetical protein J7E29_05260 [Streptomyces sp. ISL-90]|nr:hypothetical protein [Streptomyces sp. ISL-90]
MQRPFERIRRRRLSLAAIAAAFALVATPVPALAADEPPQHVEVSFDESTSDDGFTHPGIGVSAENLLRAREHVQEGAEPWATYYGAMVATKYASTTLRSANQSAVLDQPAVTAFNSQAVQSRLIQDAWGAYTQAVLYVITGDPVHRENGMRIIRIWSNMDPAAYAYYPDAHIHSGVPLQRLLMAAEIFRYSTVADGYTAYDLAWHDSDTAKLTDNLITPMTETFLHTNWRYLNQHIYPLIGAMSGYIFTDNRERYDEGVEWFTVNSTTTRPEQNGAIAAIYPLIDKNDPLNPYGYSFVQHQEMGRDQAHGWDDVNTLGVMARILTVQGTEVDPVTGTRSTADDAVSPYAFLGDRLLDGANAFVGYMLGHEIPWIDTTGGAGVLSEAYRGRLFNSIDEMYHVYRYDLGRDLEKEAPNLDEWHEQADGPIFYWGASLYNFWDPNPDYAPDYWLSLPEDVAGTTPPAPTDPKVQLEQRGVHIDGTTKVLTDGDTTFARLKASKAGSTVAVRTLMYVSRTGYSPVGVRVRTDGPATLEIRKRPELAPYHSLPLPDTHGEWRYITYDVDTKVLPGSTLGDNLAYYTAKGSGKVNVDLDHVELEAKTKLDIPAFPQGSATRLIGVAGAESARDLAATDPKGATLEYEAFGLPEGASVDAASGRLTWMPSKKQVGNHRFTLAASNGEVTSTLEVEVEVAATRQAALEAALAGFDPGERYVSDSLAEFEQVRASAEASVDTADDATFLTGLAALQEAVAALQLLTPRLADDGSFDYRGLVTSTLSAANVSNLVDGDFNTTTGDLRAPFTFDFGAGFRVSADAIGLQARYNFANRSQGANVYGSNDGRTWTLLTSRETTNTTAQNFAIETIPVIAELQDSTWRYLKVQVDHPGVPTDPVYPGISSFSEVRLHGERHEMVDAIASAALTSTNAETGKAVNGDTVTLTLVADQPLAGVDATIEGRPATASSSDGLTWTAELVLPDDVDYGRNLVFAADYRTAAGDQGATVIETTDGSSLALWNTHVSSLEIRREWVDASTVPWPGTSGTTQDNGWRMFDGDLTTYPDTTVANGWVTVVPTDATTFTFDVVRMRPRASQLPRANGTALQGSNDDGATWQTLVTFTGVAADQWYSFPLPAEAHVERLRVLDEHGGRVNIAEVQLLHDDR